MNGNVADYEQLIADLQGRDGNRLIEVVVLDSNRDGFEQVSEILSDRSGLSAVHFITHGADGMISLGGSWLTNANLPQHSEAIAKWGEALSESGDILFYGCNIAADEDGQSLLKNLSTLTGADVAASKDVTGSSSRGGDWDLEHEVGSVEAPIVGSTGEQAPWEHTLATYTVTLTTDNNPGGGGQVGDLRWAINQANANAGADIISFNISGTGAHTITPTAALPTITGQVTIDASTDDSFAANSNRPAIILDGNGLAADGLVLSNTADGSTIRGLVIRDFGTTTSHDGIEIQAGSDGNTIAGNYIGRLDNLGGDAGAGEANAGMGLYVLGANNTIEGNVISGNANNGIMLYGEAADGNVVRGNLIGTNAAGTAAIGNTLDGIHIRAGADNNIIGGTTPAERNVLSGNLEDGIEILNAGTAGNTVQGNYIGTNADGTAALGNQRFGVVLYDGVSGTTIGGTAAGAGNVISGNASAGIMLDGNNNAAWANNAIQGNWIGTDKNGAVAIANGSHGIFVYAGAGGTVIGGTASGAGNTIAYSSGDGVSLDASADTGIPVLGNAIYGNAQQGIDLANNGVTANDAGDADTGANNLQNFPVLTSATKVAAGTTIVGSLNSSANTTYRIEFFSSPTGDGTGYGEGQTYLGSTTVTTNGSGNASFNTTLAGISVTTGHAVTATATIDLGGDSYGSTSEFAANVVARSLAGHWRFDANANDSSGNNYNGTLTNGALIDTNAGTNKVGAGKLSLDGVNDHVDLSAHLANFAGLTQGTISAWIKTTTTGEGHIVSADDTAFDSAYASFFVYQNKLNFWVANGGTYLLRAQSTASVNDGNWHHVAVTVDATGNKLFIDGAQATVTYSTGSAATQRFYADVSSLDFMAIGIDKDNAGFQAPLPGLVDDVRIYDRALAAAEIAQLATTAPTITGLAGDRLDYSEGAIAAVIDLNGDASVSDIDSADFNTGTLTVSFAAGSDSAEDVLGIRNQGTGAGQIGVSGSNVTYGGTTIGTFTGGSGGSNLVVTFNANSTPAAAAVLAQNITYQNTDTGAPTAGTRTVRFVLTDGDGGTSANYDTYVTVKGGMGVWANNNTTPEYAVWSGSAFGTDANSQSVGGWVIVETAEAPTRTEIIAVGMDANGIIAGQMWNGSTWSALPFGNLVDLSSSAYWSFDVAYEQQSGRALLVWDNGTTGTTSISYRVWDGSSWSAAQTITTPLSGEARQLRLAADPGSNELVLVTTNVAKQSYALVWNGTSWGNSQILDNSGTGADLYDDSVAYESHSGDALVLFADPANSKQLAYRTWNGTTWSGQSTLSTGLSGDVKFTTLAADPTSDRIAVGVLSTGNEIWFSVWDGSAWGSSITATSSAATTAAPAMAVAFESNNSQLLAVWGINNNAVQYNTWSAAGGWGTAAAGPNVGAVPNSLRLSPDPNSDDIMLGAHDAGRDVNYALWNGSAWGAVTERTTDSGSTTGMPLDFAWLDNNRAPVISTTAFSSPENSTEVGTVAATEADANPLAYSIIGGADAAKFTIGAYTGVLSFLTPPDFDNPTDSGGNNVYDVIIRTSDQTGGSDSQAIAVTVTNLNEAPTFTTGAGTGKVTTNVSSFWDGASATLIQPDGKIVVAGSMNNGPTVEPYVARYNADGTLDPGFGPAGNGVFAFSIQPSHDGLYAVALQSDGKILVAGYAHNGLNNDFAIVRLNTNGTLDTTFDGDGIRLIDIAGDNDTARGIAVQSDGKIVVGGVAAVAGNNDFAVVRLNADGSLDASFGTGGKVTTAIGAGADEARGLAIQTDGKILLTGYSHNGTNEDVALVRYNTDGSLDTNFDGDGKRTLAIGSGYDVANAVALQSDGKIVVAGDSLISGTPDFTVMRFNADGSLDTSFDTDGMATTAVGGSSDYSKALAIQSDGRIVVVGESFNGSNNDIAVVRYNSDGSLDTTFDTDGKLTTAIGSSIDTASGVAVQSDGKIVVAGFAQFADGYTALVRYNSNGSLDTTFGATSTLNGAPTYVENGAPVVLDADVQVTDPELGAAGNYSGATLTLSRHGGANSQDAFSATGNLSVLTQGGNLVLSGVTIGTVTTNSGGTLLLTFNGNATQARVNETLRSIAYANSSNAPPASAQINWTFNDGNSGTQGPGGSFVVTGSTTVTITAVNDAPGMPAVSLGLTNEDVT